MLAELEQQKKDLLEKLRVVQAAINEEKIEAAYRDFGVRVGSIVRDNQGVEYRVFAFDLTFEWGGKPCLKANPKKADGTFGTRRRDLYRGWVLIAS